jgi:hypothetical protein
VKSSQNQINLRHIRNWAKELESSIIATHYELVLIGPCSQGVTEKKQIGKVIIPTPQNLNTDSLIERAAHRLDVYCEKKGIPKILAITREMLVSALVTKLEAFSTSSLPISREKLEQLINDWIASILNNPAIRKTPPIKERNGLKFSEWVNILVSFQLSKTGNLRLQEIVNWINQIQPATKIVDEGIHSFTQGGIISKNQVWRFYQDAKKSEEALEAIVIPPIALQAHLMIRESVRHYRRAVGGFHSKDQEEFLREMNNATEYIKKAAKLM